MSRRRHAALASLALATLVGGARADDADVDAPARAQAELLFREGSAALEAGAVAEACPKLLAAVELTRGEALGGKLVLARCYERAGRTASAWGLYREVLARATSAGQKERAAEASERSTALAARLHYLEIALAPQVAAVPALVVSIDGRQQPPAAWQAPVPMDPGEAVVKVSADGKVAQMKRAHIPSTPGTSRLVFDQPLRDVAAPANAARRVGASSRPSPFWSPLRIAGVSLGAVGVLGLAAGTIVGAVARSRYNDALTQGKCTGSPPVCDDASPAQDARNIGDVGTGVFLAGAGVAAAGLVIFLVAPSPTGNVTATAISVGVTPTRLFARAEF